MFFQLSPASRNCVIQIVIGVALLDMGNFFGSRLHAQSAGVQIVRDRGEPFEELIKQANEFREAGKLLTAEKVTAQLSRKVADLKLPAVAKKKLSDREIWERSRQAHIRVGWHYLCKKCNKWHQNLAGGYLITADGAVATCYHVAEPDTDMREGYLVAANDAGDLLPVTEVLAADTNSDTAIVKVQLPSPALPLPLNSDITPGDAAWCFSDPLGRAKYFTKGMVNRFCFTRFKKAEAVRMEVSTDWAPGSSGSAVLDECGNAMGHVSEISSASPTRARGTNQLNRTASAVIVFHTAVPAASVRALVKPTAKDTHR